MKVGTCTTSYLYNTYAKPQKSTIKPKSENACSDTVCFTSNFVVKILEPKLIKELPPIKTSEEYSKLLEKIKSIKAINGERFWEYDSEPLCYKGVNSEYIGLLPYCDGQDVSYYINRYLGGILPFDLKCRASEENICDLIRALDYSLARLDEEFGGYNGIVYRSGFFSPNSKQYASTSINPKFAAEVGGVFVMSSEYSVILAKNAHKIYDFQKMAKSPYAQKEKEILIGKNEISLYKQVLPEQHDKRIIRAIDKFATCIYNHSMYSPVNKLFPNRQIFSKDTIMKKIKVYSQD